MVLYQSNNMVFIHYGYMVFCRFGIMVKWINGKKIYFLFCNIEILYICSVKSIDR